MPPPVPEDDDDEGRRRNSLLFLVIAAVVVVAGIWLVNKLIDMRNMQNCLESGRRNCAPISTDGR